MLYVKSPTPKVASPADSRSTPPACGVCPNAATRMIGSARAIMPAEIGITSTAIESSAQRSDVRRRRARRPGGSSREDRGMDRLGEHGVRREEEDERHLIRDHPRPRRGCRITSAAPSNNPRSHAAVTPHPE